MMQEVDRKRAPAVVAAARANRRGCYNSSSQLVFASNLSKLAEAGFFISRTTQ